MVALVALVAATMALLVVRAERPREDPWPSYADMFDRVSEGVVNVAVEAPDRRVGSGFAISQHEVVTARHLVQDATTTLVTPISGWPMSATVVGSDARTDLALLRVEAGGLRPAALGSSHRLRVGDTVLAIGNPYGLGHTLSVGVLGQHQRRRLPSDRAPRVDFLQLSLPLNPGNSGGPVFDQRGDVVGVLSGTYAQGQGIAFAVPAEALIETLPALRGGKHVTRAFLGVTTHGIAGEVVIASIIPSSPADRAGLLPGDVLVSAAGRRLNRPLDLQEVLDGVSGRTELELDVSRDGESRQVRATLTDWATAPVVVSGMILNAAPGAGGRVVAVRAGSRADRSGVRKGDVVRAVNGEPVRAPADVKFRLTGGEAAQLDLVRDGRPTRLLLE